MKIVIAAGLVAAASFAVLTGAGAASAATSSDWSAPAVVSSHTGSDYLTTPGITQAQLPVVATSASGAAVAAWRSGVGTVGSDYKTNTYVATKSPSGVWSKVRLLARNTLTGQVFVGIRRNGAATAVWTRGTSVVYAVHRIASGWGPTRVLAGVSASTLGSFSMTPNGYGVLGFTRLQTVSGIPTYLAYVRKLAPSGVWRPAIRISQDAPPSDGGTAHPRNLGAADVSAVIDNSGAVTATWQWLNQAGEGGTTGPFEYTTVGPGGRAAAYTALPFSDEGLLPVQASAGGGAAFGWLVGDGTSSVVVRFRTAGGAWQQHTISASSSAASLHDVMLAVGDSGVAAFWVQNVADTSGATPTFTASVLAQTYAGGAWGSPVTVDTQSVPDFTSSTLVVSDAAAASGRTYLSWTAVDSSVSHARVTTIQSGALSTTVQSVASASGPVAAGGAHATVLFTEPFAGPNADTPLNDLLASSR